MASRWTQAERLLLVQTPLGEDALMLRSFTGSEAMSQWFTFRLDLLSENRRIGFNDLMGHNITWGVRLADEREVRYFNGLVSRFVQLPSDHRLAHYQAEVVPWLWLLTLTADCRIFQNKTVPEIIEQVFRYYGFTDYELHLSGSHPSRVYCVQYRETAFNFVSRLAEEEGIFYFFRHENGKHTLVLGDSPSVHAACPGAEDVWFEPAGGPGFGREQDYVFEWSMGQQLRTGQYALQDFNFETPNFSLLAEVPSCVQQGNEGFETFDYPGRYAARAEGEALARLRIEGEEAAHVSVSGASYCRSFSSGFKVNLSGLERSDQNTSYVLTSVTHSAEVSGFHSDQRGAGELLYQNNFTAIPYDVPFRPPCVTPRPVVHGSQTAIVVGPEGEEIHSDPHGRVKVQFHWDRRGQLNDQSSCWIRVSQPWAGKGWGGIAIPRIGQEVIVDFLEGDPDRPIITGRVYNAMQTPPYSLPGEQTKTTLKSHSSKGGGGFNEIRFEDKKGSEQVFIHAEKRLDIRSKGSRFESVGGESHLTVNKTQYELVKEDQHLKVLGEKLEEVTGATSLTTGEYHQRANTVHAIDAGQEIHLKAGMTAIIEAGVQLSLKVGGNFIDINPGGVFIQGSMVMINSGGAAGSGSGAQPATPDDPQPADTAQPGGEPAKRRSRPPRAHQMAMMLLMMQLIAAQRSGAAFCVI